MKTFKNAISSFISLIVAMFAIVTGRGATSTRAGLCEGDYNDFLTGGMDDTELNLGDMDRVLVTQGDMDEGDVFEGAMVRARKVAQRKFAGRGPSAANAAKMPGVALMGVSLPAVYIQAAKMVQPGTDLLLSGNLFKFNLDENPIRNPFSTITKTVGGAVDPGTKVSVTFNNSDLPSGCDVYSVPVIFATIAASQLNARNGLRYTMEITGKSRDGVVVTTDSFDFERSANDKPIRVQIIPYIRSKDNIVPLNGAFGKIGGELTNIAFTVSITGMPDSEALQVTMPGIDSSELKETLKQWGLSLK